MKNMGTNIFACRVAVTLASFVAPLMTIEIAHADCTPAAPVNNTTVTCTGGGTITANDPNGYGTGVETGDIIIVDPNTTVTGVGSGIAVHDATIQSSGSIIGGDPNLGGGSGITVDSATITNGNGTISGGFFGIKANTSVTVQGNDGTISSTGVSGIAIDATGGTATVTNGTGSISALNSAINASTVTVNGNNGTIEATGLGGVAIRATGDANVTNDNGIIQSNQAGGIAISAGGNVSVDIHAGAIQTAGVGGIAVLANGNATVTNRSGTIQATGGTDSTGAGGAAISAKSVNINGNDGRIEALGSGGIAVVAGTGTATVANGTGAIQGFINAIAAQTVNVTSNEGTIAAHNINASGVAIFAAAITVANGSGFISADKSAIQSNGALTVTSNAGKIEATGVGSVGNNVAAISANIDATVTNTGGTIEAKNVGGIAISSLGTATVNNISGLIRGDARGISAQSSLNVINGGQIGALGSQGGGIGIFSGADATVANNSFIFADGIDGIGISANGNVMLNNRSSIFADGQNGTGVSANGSLTISNATGGNIRGDAVGISAKNAVNVTDNNDTIQGGAAGIGIKSFGTAQVSNLSGGIITGGTNAINAAQSVTVTGNLGSITATGLGQGSVAIFVPDGAATITNGKGGLISGDGRGILASTMNIEGNDGTIEARGTGGVALLADNVTVINSSGIIQAPGGTGIAAGLATVVNGAGGFISGGAFAIQAGTLNVTNDLGATISGGNIGIEGSGSIVTAGRVEGATKSVNFTGGAGAINSLTLKTGAVLSGDAVGSIGATNNLVLQGHGTANSNFQNFNSLDVQADTTWVWNTNATIDPIGGSLGTTVSTGTFAVDGALNSPITVKSGGTLAGHGNITGPVSVAGGGTVAPGAVVPFSTLNVSGNVNFDGGSVFQVNVNSAGTNDLLQTTTATITTGSTVNVLAQGGTYAPSTKYTILVAAGGGLGGSNTFSGVKTNLAFLSPTLSYDANDVFLTMALNNSGGGGAGGTTTGFGFVSAAQTRNQIAVAGALDASPVSSPLVVALLNQTLAGARQAFDALSGEVFGTLHNTQAEEVQTTRAAMLNRMRQASYAGVPGELGALGYAGPELAYAPGEAFPAKAPTRPDSASRDLTFWAQGLGGWGHADSDGNAASVKSRFGGFLSGADARLGDTWRAGLVAGYMRTDLNVADRSSSAGIDSVQFGGYAGGRLGAFNVRGGASYSYDSIDSSRGIVFPGFSDQTHAHFHGNVGQVFGEVGYGMTLGQVAVEPLAGLAYVHVHDGSFAETGGLAALSASSANESTGYSTLGIRAATAVPLANGTVLVPRGSLQWQYAFGDVTPVSAMAFQSTGTSFTVAGIPIARNAAFVEGGFDWRFSPQAKLGVFYQGELAAHAESHAFKGGFTLNF